MMVRKMMVLWLICCCFAGLSAQPTREQLAQIRVDKEGNFKYWNSDAASLAQLKAFVTAVTTEGSGQYVPARDRLAVFDMDGTLLCETAPFYMNWLVMLHRLLDDTGYTPTEELRRFGEAAKAGMYDPQLIDREMDDRAQYVQAEIFKGLTMQEMDDWMKSFLEKPCEGLEGLTWGTALYWPMIEVVSYLVANDFQVYICSGTAQDMLRPLIEDVLPIGRHQVMGSEVHYVPEGKAEEMGWETPVIMETYGFDDLKGQRVVRGLFKQKCTKWSKVDIMTRQLGQKPILTFGNSSGDYPMFEFVTTGNSYPSMAFCLLCDDVERELGNAAKAEKCRTACEANGWVPVSMRDDWTTIYGPDVKPTPTAVRSVIRDAESSGQAYTVSGTPATEQTRGIVISNHQKTVRK